MQTNPIIMKHLREIYGSVLPDFASKSIVDGNTGNWIVYASDLNGKPELKYFMNKIWCNEAEAIKLIKAKILW